MKVIYLLCVVGLITQKNPHTSYEHTYCMNSDVLGDTQDTFQCAKQQMFVCFLSSTELNELLQMKIFIGITKQTLKSSQTDQSH